MKVGLLITDGGPHSADKWAEATASHIVDIAGHVAGERRVAAVKLEAAIIDILEGHHSTVQNGERNAIATVGHDRLQHECSCEHHLSLDDAVAEICAATKGTPWEEDFAKPEMIENLKPLLASHLQTNMEIERGWHAARNPDTPQAQEFHAARNTGGKQS